MNTLSEFSQRSEALRHHIARYSITLVTCSDGVPNGLGSGTCVEYNGIFGIATAAHVVRDVKSEEISIIYKPSATNLNSYVTSTLFNGGRDKDPLDVAFLLLSDDGLNEINKYKTFLPCSRLRRGVSIVMNDLFVVYGTPSELLDPAALEKKELRAQPIAYVTISLDKLPGQLIESNDIALEYPKYGNIITEDGSPANLPKAEGLSGGGMWIASAHKEGIWSPEDAALVGVEISWHPRERWIRGNQIQHVLSLLPGPTNL